MERKRDHELWVGVFVVVGIIATFATLFVMTDAATFRGRYIITTFVPSAGGIRRGDPVQMRGVNIGRVQRFRMAPEGVAIRLEIEGEYEVPVDSHVELKSGSLLGGMIAEVVPGTSQKLLRRVDSIPGKSVGGVFDSASNLASQSEKVLERMQAALSDRTVDIETADKLTDPQIVARVKEHFLIDR